MTVKQIIAAWLFNAMCAWAPPTPTYYPSHITKSHPDVHETEDAIKERYLSISSDLVSVIYSNDYSPMNSGEEARARDAVLTLSTASFESGGFRKDVDAGYTKGDHDQSFCIMQVWLPGLRKTSQGWQGTDLIQDRQKCFAAGLDKMRLSWRMCAHLPLIYRLSAYVAGHCKLEETHSRVRTQRAIDWINKNPVPLKDQQVLN